MKILLTGGGTGGHFYPLIAIAEELNRIADDEKFVNFKLYYMSDAPYNEDALKQQFITYMHVPAGKMRVYFSIQNFFDLFKTAYGIVVALLKLFNLYPDVVVSKGAYASFPVLFAARILRIPVIIHESDTVPGRVSRWSGKFARRIAVSYPEAAAYFDQAKVSVTGQPVRQTISRAAKEGAKEFYELDPNIPTIGIFAGSQGAEAINKIIEQLLPTLVSKYQIIHQTGASNIDEARVDAGIILGDSTRRTRYHAYGTLNDLQTKMFGGAVELVIGRSGSSVFEIAAWGKPSILVPYPHAHDDHQRKNAYHYARTGACVVIEEQNLTPSVLLTEIEEILGDKQRYDVMAEHAHHFFKADAAHVIASEAVKISLGHEK